MEAIISVALVTLGWLLGWVAFGRPPRLGAHGALPVEAIGSAGETMAIIIPARNEARSLPLLLDDLDRFRPDGSGVIVVDDDSTDGTAEIARRYPFVQVLTSAGPPEGLAGKPWACSLGARSVDAHVLCFLDADVRLEPGALDDVRSLRDERGGLVSVQPWHRTERPWEQVSSIFNVISMMGAGVGGRGEPTAAFGPVLMTSRADYEAVGGHMSVATEVVEDLALAEGYRAQELPVTVRCGGDRFRFRMYPDGPASLVEGWSKNFASGAAATTPWRLAAAVLWIVAMGSTVQPALEAALGSAGVWLPAIGYLAFVAQLRAMFAVVGRFGIVTAALFPLLIVVFLAVFARSLWMTTVRRTVRWRGRDIHLTAATR